VVNEFTAEAMDALRRYPWPGNVRELRTAIEHAVVLCRGEKITLADLPPNVRGAGSSPGDGTDTRRRRSDDQGSGKATNHRALKDCHPTDGRGEELGMSRRTLHVNCTRITWKDFEHAPPVAGSHLQI